MGTTHVFFDLARVFRFVVKKILNFSVGRDLCFHRFPLFRHAEEVDRTKSRSCFSTYQTPQKTPIPPSRLRSIKVFFIRFRDHTLK